MIIFEGFLSFMTSRCARSPLIGETAKVGQPAFAVTRPRFRAVTPTKRIRRGKRTGRLAGQEIQQGGDKQAGRAVDKDIGDHPGRQLTATVRVLATAGAKTILSGRAAG